jgi:serine acetyltransferase
MMRLRNEAKLTPHDPRHRLPSDIKQAREVGKAVKIGHGPATVIGETP